MKEIFRRLRRGLINTWLREVRGDHPLREAQRYKRDGGTSLLYRFPLNESDFVLDIGGHIGGFAADIHALTKARVHLFEPVERFHATCQRRFAGNPAVTCHRFALGAKDEYLRISDANEASSLHAATSSGAEVVEVREAGAAIRSLGIDRIGLVKLNIEGAEYDVLPALLDTGIVSRTKFLLIQFHTIGDYVNQRQALRARLAETHEELWCYDFVWEAWALREDGIDM